jgi:hypothetical protein
VIGARGFRPPAWLLTTLAVAGTLQLVVVNYWPGFASPNERSRAYQAIAIVERGTLSIDRELERYGAMEDVALSGTPPVHAYPNKAPGLLPLLVPAAFVAQVLAEGRPERQLALTLFLGRLVAASLPFLATLVLLAHLLVPSYPRGGPVAVAAYGLATPALAASVLLFSHAFTGLLLLAAYSLLLTGPRVPPRRAAVAGSLLGWAATAEYTVAIPGAVLALLALPRLVGIRGRLAALAGGLVPLGLLGAYNFLCFGSPFSLSTAHEAHAPLAALVNHGLFGISLPQLSGLVGLLISPSRGLLIWAPITVLAIWPSRSHSPSATSGTARAAALAPLALLLLFSGYPNWHGGWFAGPRYLLPALPLVFLRVGAAAESLLTRLWARVFATAALVWGCGAAFLTLATFPFPPEDFSVPWANLALRLAGEGVHAPSWLAGPAVLPLVALLGLIATALLCFLAAGGEARILAYGPAVAIVVFALATGLRTPTTWRGRLEEAVIHDVYAGGAAGRLESLTPTCATPAEREQIERWISERGRPRPGHAE